MDGALRRTAGFFHLQAIVTVIDMDCDYNHSLIKNGL